MKSVWRTGLLLSLATGAGLGQTTFSLDRAVYAPGDAIVATWTGGPGNATDWIGIYPRGVVPDGNPGSTIWLYVNGTQSATSGLPDGSVTFASPGLPDGEWSAHFLANDGYTPITARVDFEVTPANAEPFFVVDSIRRVHAIAGRAYTGTLAAYARAGSAGGLTFAKLAGADWLSVSAEGSLGGTPALSDVGRQQFTVQISDSAGATATATLHIEVFAPGTVHLSRLKVLAFNVWVGTGNVSDGYRKGLDSILLSDADIVAICENRGRAGEWAADLGWHVYQAGSDNAVLSRYPVTDTFGASAAVGARLRLADSPLREVNFWSCHLTAYPYGPYDARDEPGSNADKIAAALAAETNSGRIAQINSILSNASAHLADADTAPVFLLGDFNCPSHLDWTAATAAAGMHFGLALGWPVTRHVENAGMIDAYRAIHPDPVVMPGDTWTPIDPGDVQDRIDMVHFKGSPLAVTDCRVFTTIAEGRWPSDHAGVLAVFDLAPVDSEPDGLGDAWEVKHFGSTASEDASGNPDGDWLNNFGEQGFGTDPNDRNDSPSLRLVPAAGEFHIAYRRLAGGSDGPSGYTAQAVRYLIELSDDLTTWAPAGARAVPIDPPLDLGSGIEEAVIRIAPPAGPFPARQFVRIRLLPAGL